MTEHRTVTTAIAVLCLLGCACAVSPTVNHVVSIAVGVLLGLAALAGVVWGVWREQQRRDRRASTVLLDLRDPTRQRGKP